MTAGPDASSSTRGASVLSAAFRELSGYGLRRGLDERHTAC